MEALIAKIKTRKVLVPLIGVLVGLAGGFAYYHFIGCSNGTCAITSNPWLSMLWGASVGYLIADMFSGRSKKPVENTEI